jgi:hypothetical protein
MQPLQTLSGIPGVQLRVNWNGIILYLNHPCISQWVKQHGQLISHLTALISVREDRLKLRDFAEAAAPCRSFDLTTAHSPDQVLDLSDLDPVAGSLGRLACRSILRQGSLRGTSAFNSMSHLTALCLLHEDLGSEESWGLLAKLTSLQQLSLTVSGSGDPSPLSALTGLSSLRVQNLRLEDVDPVSFGFSSLQPLSAMWQLEELHLGDQQCAITSLQGLAGLSNLRVLELNFADYGGRLRILDGISPEVVDVSIAVAEDLPSLAGIECCTRMENLTLFGCGVSSLQPLSGLSSLKQLKVRRCGLRSLGGLNSMSLQSLQVKHCSSLTQLFGLEHLSTLMSLTVTHCGVTSLQPLSQLGEGLQKLKVSWCRQVQEEFLELPHVQPTADVVAKISNVREVVLAGGVRLECIW